MTANNDWVAGLVWGVGITAVLVTLIFVWQITRSVYFWAAAKVYGWDKHEKFMRETAWVEREAKKEERQRERDLEAGSNTERRRIGVFIVAACIAILAFNIGLPWWGCVAMYIAAFLGLTMAAGLSFKW
jgi:hypothetical protein